MIRLRALLPALVPGLLLSACQQAAEPDSAATTAAAPETKPGLSLSQGRLILPAVKGNPAAAYFALANGSVKPVTLAAVSVEGAGMAMLHETKEVDGHSTMDGIKDPVIAPGETLALAPGGRHVMVFDLPADLKPGATVEITLIFADGDKLSAPLTVEAVGSAGGGAMSGTQR
jgi:copper(I)-binding protein